MQGPRVNRIWRRVVLPLVAVAIIALYQYSLERGGTTPPGDRPYTGAVEEAYAERRSGIWVEVNGSIRRRLPDDNTGSRHQRFILQTESGHTVLVAHNLDLADKVPLETGDTVRVRGRYEWNERGGVIHWTHHDPDGNLSGGWVEFRDRRYR